MHLSNNPQIYVLLLDGNYNLVWISFLTKWFNELKNQISPINPNKWKMTKLILANTVELVEY